VDFVLSHARNRETVSAAGWDHEAYGRLARAADGEDAADMRLGCYLGNGQIRDRSSATSRSGNS
jgi:hypothetical protein